MKIPYITPKQMKKVDYYMIQEMKIPLGIMMENAGRSLAKIIKKENKKEVLVFVGKGNNGGGGLVTARHLTNSKRKVTVVLAYPLKDLKDEPRRQFNILKKMGVSYEIFNEKTIVNKIKKSEIIIDALVGYSLKGSPKGNLERIISLINKSKSKVFSLDIPSGLNPDTGEIKGLSINADVTLTLALPKKGFLNQKTKNSVGDLYLADISIPKKVYNELNIKVPDIFNESEVVKINLKLSKIKKFIRVLNEKGL